MIKINKNQANTQQGTQNTSIASSNIAAFPFFHPMSNDPLVRSPGISNLRIYFSQTHLKSDDEVKIQSLSL